MVSSRPYHNFSHVKKAGFLSAFRQGSSISKAAELIGTDRRTVYNWLEKDEDFHAAFQLAKVDATEALEDEARRRATEGVRKEKPIYHNGSLLTTVIETEYSDTLLIFLLKGLAPEKYRDNVNVTQTQIIKTVDAEAWDKV